MQRAVAVTRVVTRVAPAASKNQAALRVKRPEKVKARQPGKAAARRVLALAVAPEERARLAVQGTVVAEKRAPLAVRGAVVAEKRAPLAVLAVAEELAAGAALAAPEKEAAAARAPPARQIARATRTARWLGAS